MRMRMARGSGILSTFFTYKNGSEGAGTFWEEIDIEVFGKDDATTWQSNIITGLGTRVTTEAEHTHPTSLADGYHTYALVWTPDYIAWEVDGNEIRRVGSGQLDVRGKPGGLRSEQRRGEGRDVSAGSDPSRHDWVFWRGPGRSRSQRAGAGGHGRSRRRRGNRRQRHNERERRTGRGGPGFEHGRLRLEQRWCSW
jgi:endo-1,3-1,4-beta-glycanase ExoK